MAIQIVSSHFHSVKVDNLRNGVEDIGQIINIFVSYFQA